MGTFLVIVVCVWTGLAIVCVLALAHAAARRMPSPDRNPGRQTTAMDLRDAPLTPRLTEQEKEIDSVFDT